VQGQYLTALFFAHPGMMAAVEERHESPGCPTISSTLPHFSSPIHPVKLRVCMNVLNKSCVAKAL
jgi:hypothetical protein